MPTSTTTGGTQQQVSGGQLTCTFIGGTPSQPNVGFVLQPVTGGGSSSSNFVQLVFLTLTEFDSGGNLITSTAQQFGSAPVLQTNVTSFPAMVTIQLTNGAIVQVFYYLSNSDLTVNFHGISVFVPAGNLKFLFSITNWPWSSIGAGLELNVSLTTDQGNLPAPVLVSESGSIDTFQSQTATEKVQIQVVRLAFADNENFTVAVSQFPTAGNYLVQFTRFAESLEWDPQLSVLFPEGSSSGGGSDGAVGIGVGVSVGTVIFLLIVLAIVAAIGYVIFHVRNKHRSNVVHFDEEL
jgi:hypothetical protein